jgi:hypothetical protein
VVIVRSGESQEYMVWYQSHGGHGVTEVRCEHNCISQVPSLAGCEHTVLKTSGVFKNRNSRTLDKGRVRTSQKSSQSTVEQGANISEKLAGYSGAGCELSEKLAGYSGAGCEPLRTVCRILTGRVRTPFRLLSGGV